MKVGLSGTGRIGRLCIRRLLSRNSTQLEIGLINSTSPLPALAHLLQYDTVHGKWEADIQVEDGGLLINGTRIPVVAERDPAKLPWKAYGVDLVIDATGKFTDRESLQKHTVGGAGKVLLTAPGKGLDCTIVMGVNEESYDCERHQFISVASCTTNCLAPVLHILDRAFGVKQGWMTSIHAFTNDQNHLDNPHKDLRRARACTSSIIPTSTGVSKALQDVLPHLAGRVSGMSVRVPTNDVSLLDLQVTLTGAVREDEVKEAFRRAIRTGMGPYVDYNELPLVSSDYIGCEKSAVVDGLSLMIRGDHVKILAWYDNEWAYACRVIDLAQHITEAEARLHTKGEQWIS